MKKTFEIEGMTCASCVRTIEKSVENVGGVSNISVNLTTEKMSVEFDEDLTSNIIKAVSDAGYKASLKEDFKHVNIKIAGMTCSTCVNTIEKSLSSTKGVNSVSVNYATETASVSYDPTLMNLDKIHNVIKDAGYEPITSVSEKPI